MVGFRFLPAFQGAKFVPVSGMQESDAPELTAIPLGPVGPAALPCLVFERLGGH